VLSRCRRLPPPLVAAVALACLVAAVTAALSLRHSDRRSPLRGVPQSTVSLRALSATDELAVPMGAATDRVDRVVVLGDSVATGAGCDCAPFGPRLAGLLAARDHRAVRVSTYARDGYETTDLVSQLDDDPAAVAALHRASAVVVIIGANDFDESAAAGGCGSAVPDTRCYDARLRALPGELGTALGKITSLSGSRARLVVAGYWNVFLDGAVAASKGPTYERTSDALTRRVNDVIRTAAQQAHASYVDLYGPFHRAGTAGTTALLASDGDHPGPTGHQRIAELLARYLTA
jgi:lysophospholipase L1-like esterase